MICYGVWGGKIYVVLGSSYSSGLIYTYIGKYKQEKYHTNWTKSTKPPRKDNITRKLCHLYKKAQKIRPDQQSYEMFLVEMAEVVFAAE